MNEMASDLTENPVPRANGNGAPKRAVRPDGFLPIDTNLFDRIFIAVVVFVAIHLFWMRFVEQSLSIYVATAISVVVGAIIIKRG
jgi:predicted small integral membrane protein